jgi:hypothetical protein
MHPDLIAPALLLLEERAPYDILRSISTEENRGHGTLENGALHLFFGPCKEEAVTDAFVEKKLVNDDHRRWFAAIPAMNRFCTRYMQHDGTCFLLVENGAEQYEDFLITESHAEYRDRDWKAHFPGWYAWWDETNV